MAEESCFTSESGNAANGPFVFFMSDVKTEEKISNMAAPTEFTLETVREFMLEKGGKVTNHELVKHFKQFLTDPYTKGNFSVSRQTTTCCMFLAHACLGVTRNNFHFLVGITADLHRGPSSLSNLDLQTVFPSFQFDPSLLLLLCCCGQPKLVLAGLRSYDLGLCDRFTTHPVSELTAVSYFRK